MQTRDLQWQQFLLDHHPLIFHMSGQSGEESGTRWGPAETAKFRELVKSGKIDIDAVDPKSVRKVWEKYWPQRKIETFRANYRKTAASLRVERESRGARARFAAGGGRLFLFISYSLCCC